MRWLGEDALRRYLRLRPPSFVPNKQEVRSDMMMVVRGGKNRIRIHFDKDGWRVCRRSFRPYDDLLFMRKIGGADDDDGVDDCRP